MLHSRSSLGSASLLCKTLRYPKLAPAGRSMRVVSAVLLGSRTVNVPVCAMVQVTDLLTTYIVQLPV